MLCDEEFAGLDRRNACPREIRLLGVPAHPKTTPVPDCAERDGRVFRRSAVKRPATARGRRSIAKTQAPCSTIGFVEIHAL
jgi:hypothetical protein